MEDAVNTLSFGRCRRAGVNPLCNEGVEHNEPSAGPMESWRSYVGTYKDIIVYHDYQPLLLFWNISDIANNRVLWDSYWEYQESGAESVYIQYALYFCVSLGMLFSLPDLRSCSRFVSAYLLLYVFSTTKFVVTFLTDTEFAANPDIKRSLVVTGVYFTLWCWIYLKMRVELAHRNVNGG